MFNILEASPHIEHKYIRFGRNAERFHWGTEVPMISRLSNTGTIWILMVLWKSECMRTSRGRRSTLDRHQNFVAGAASALHNVAGLICRKKRRTRIAMLTRGVAAQRCDSPTL